LAVVRISFGTVNIQRVNVLEHIKLASLKLLCGFMLFSHIIEIRKEKRAEIVLQPSFKSENLELSQLELKA
jgi:hypothetical protein